MNMVQFTAKSKENFFDRPKVQVFLDERESKVFNRIGARIRLTAMRSMRSRKKSKSGKARITAASPAGQPPRRHVPMGSGLSKIYYTYDQVGHRVLIGPVKFNWSAYPDVTIPQLHEFGGTVQVFEADFSFSQEGWKKSAEPDWRRVVGRRKRYVGKRPTRTRRATYPKRPFMYPALERNKKFILDSWATASVSVGD